ncbi:MAG: glycosyltransferase family 9 protein [Deltaproteobacteria bacterium]|jgi:ADP-heptose:LPS heptosyltransferase|nr:glycosyltransferase family 9 protein [Deltaproteobacteria bacterium]
MSVIDPGHWVVVRLSALGDTVLTTGVLRHWHETRGLTFTVITRTAFAPVFAGHPAVREVVPLADADLRGHPLRVRWRELAAAYSGHGLIDLHGTGRTRLLGLYWSGPIRRYPKLALERRLFLISGGRLCAAALRAADVSQRYALALEPRGALPPPAAQLLPRLYLNGEELAEGGATAARARGEKTRLVALHPFAAHSGKAWPAGRWLELMQRLDEQGAAWCVIGQGAALALPGAVVPAGRDLRNRCSLRQSAALLAACTLLVTGDSGPMHLAAAVGTPVVALFGSTTREWGFYPADPGAVILERDMRCRPCGLHGAKGCDQDYACLSGIGADEVLRAMERCRAEHCDAERLP